MAGNDDIVPLIERALRAPDPKAALLQAMTQIKVRELQCRTAQGRARAEHSVGTALRHIEAARRRMAAEVDLLVQEFMIELATGTFRGDEQERQTALGLIAARPTWCEE